jgi:hypothetical protein
MINPPHYYEAHVTIEPVFDERLDKFKELCAEFNFRVADLLMQKRKEDTPERSAKDQFCTGRSNDYTTLRYLVGRLARALRANDFIVTRWKIEAALLDSKYGDIL